MGSRFPPWARGCQQKKVLKPIPTVPPLILSGASLKTILNLSIWLTGTPITLVIIWACGSEGLPRLGRRCPAQYVGLRFPRCQRDVKITLFKAFYACSYCGACGWTIHKCRTINFACNRYNNVSRLLELPRWLRGRNEKEVGTLRWRPARASANLSSLRWM